MRSHESNAVVLGTRDMGESDLLVELLARDAGRIVGVAKAAKKSKRRFVNTFDLGHLIRVKYYLPRGRELFLIEDASLIDPHGRLSGSLSSMAYAALVIELVRELFPEAERSTDLFETTALLLSLLDERGAREDLVWLFVLRILKISGIAPLFGACVRCRSRQADTADRLFVPEAGGVVCGSCCAPADRAIGLSCGTITALVGGHRRAAGEARAYCADSPVSLPDPGAPSSRSSTTSSADGCGRPTSSSDICARDTGYRPISRGIKTAPRSPSRVWGRLTDAGVVPISLDNAQKSATLYEIQEV